MPSGFGDLTAQAQRLVAAGDFAGAHELLATALCGADPRPTYASAELAEAAGLHARVLVALGQPQSARGWAAFAYSASSRLHGRSDPRTVTAGATLAAVLHRVGSYARAARLYREVIIELTAADGPESLRVLAAHADLATVEYARGECTLARDRLRDAWELHREVYGDGHPSGIKMLARLGAMQRDCGRSTESQETLALAQELCQQHLLVDNPLAAQIATLARAAANPEHVCADGPSETVGVDASTVPATPVAFSPESGPSAKQEPVAAGPYGHPEWQGRYAGAPYGTGEHPGVYRAGAHAGPFRPAGSGIYASVNRASDPLPPSVSELTRTGPVWDGDDRLPVRRGGRLPVPVRPPTRRRDRRLLFTLVGGLIVVAGALAVILGFARVG